MRNLKRALSLALASVMLLGMMVVGTSAASYPDVDENDNVEAIEVLNAVKVMIGDRGNFKPDAAVNRHEMAVIMAKLVLGNDTADNYVGTHPFTDVAPWADKYVAACYENGIAAGTSKTTFGGDQPLTAVEAAAFMLRALGYKDLSKGASDWSVPVTAMANQIRLFSGVASNPKEKLDRNQVAQLALNTLKSPVVDLKDNTFTASDGNGQLIISGGSREYIVRSSEAAYAQAIDATETRGNSASGVGGYTIELGEHLYNGDLKLVTTSSDEFERPARTWLYDGKEVGTYAKDELLKASYTAGVSCKTLYDLLSRANLLDYDFEYYVDGKLDDADADDILTRSTSDFGATGRGVLTEVYVDNSGSGKITIVSINTWLAQATADYNKTRETVNLKVHTTSDGVTKTVDADDVPSIANLKKDNWVLVNMTEKDRDALEVVAVDDVEIKTDVAITKFSKGSDADSDSDTNSAFFKSLTTGGQEYKSSAKAAYNDEVLDLYANNLLTNKTYTVYVDNYGYAIGVELYSGEDSYVFITGYDGNGSNIADGTAKANAIFTDGTSKTINVNVKDTNKNIDKATDGVSDGPSADYYEQWADPATTGKAFSHNRWYTYTVDKNNEYTLNPVERMFTTWVEDDNGMTIKCNNARINENPAIPTTPATPTNYNSKVPATNPDRRAYGNDDSVYIIADMGTTSKATADDDLSGKVITGVDALYTGVQNVEIDVFVSANVDTALTNSKDSTPGSDTYALYDGVYTLYDKNNYIIASVIVGDAKGGDATLAYIKTAATSERIEDDTYYWTFDAILDGEIQELTVKSKFANTIKSLDVGTVMELRYDGEYVNGIKPVTEVYDESVYTTQAIDEEKVYDVDDLTVAGSNVADNLNWQGSTLYLTDDHSDYGLTVLKDAKAVVNQPVGGSNKWLEYDSVSDAVGSLGDADNDDDNNKLGFDGRIVAVLDSRGVAKWVLFISNTDVKTGTTVTTGSKISGVDENVILGGDADDFIRTLPDGAMIFPDMTTAEQATVDGGWGTGVSPKDVIFFKYTRPASSAASLDVAATLTIKNSSGKTVYAEMVSGTLSTGVDSEGGGYFFVQVSKKNSGDTFGNKQAGFDLSTKPLSAGKYTWTISGKNITPVKGEFTIG